MGLPTKKLFEWILKRERLAKIEVQVCFPYRAAICTEAIGQLKYSKNTVAAKLLAEAVWPILERFEVDVIVPAPISKRTRKERGYNQIEVLLEEIKRIAARETRNQICHQIRYDILEKRHDTKKQSLTSSRGERLKNLQSAFRVQNPALIQGKTLLLVDDVYTTGATSEEMKNTLLRAGAKTVTIFCLAH